MTALAYYLLKVTIISGLLFGYYHLALKDKLFHQWNRFYLLASIFFSLTMPLVSFSIQTSGSEDNKIITALQVVAGADEMVANYQPAPDTKVSTEFILSGIFILISIAMTVILFLALFRITRMAHKYDIIRLDDIHFINTREPGTPFSFFHYIFWNQDIDIHTPNGKRIFEHEMVHVREHHSWDKIFLQMVLTGGWINPFFWLIRAELHMIHEFIADRKSIGEKDSTAFAELILQTAYPQYQHMISNPFFHNSIKRRLTMINKSKHPGMNYLSRISALIVAAFIVLAFTLKPENKNNVVAPVHLDKKLTVVIDAGHGGLDNGAIGGDVVEKNLNLQISKMVKEVNTNPNIQILLTRDNDQTLQLPERIQLGANKNAQLFISIHASAQASQDNSSKEMASGFEAYVAKNNPTLADQNVRIASILLQNLSSVYKSDLMTKKSEKGIYVLDKNTIPGVILECGYINNVKDREFFTNPSNQKKVAEIILKSVEQYFSANVLVSNNEIDTLPKKAAKSEKAEKPEKLEKTEKGEKPEKAEKPAKGEKPEKAAKPENSKAPTRVSSNVPVAPVKPVSPVKPASPVKSSVSPVNSESPVKVESVISVNNVSEPKVSTTTNKQVQTNVVTSVNTSVNAQSSSKTVVNTKNDKQPVITTQSVNTNINQQRNDIHISSTSPENNINISVNQTTPGDSSSSLRINNSGPEPLYVIDGVISSKSIVNGIDPNRIQSINVLKGAGATKIYGDNGRHGVVQIITKK